MRIVLDTNVLVSGLLSPHRAPGHIVRMVAAGTVRLCHDARILDEYREVLARARFGFSPDDVEALLDQIEADGESFVAAPLPKPLPDRDDEPFLDVAVAAAAEALVTGNLRRFPKPARHGVRVLAPAAFLRSLRRP
jgi:putative PIN family toxin of toxin-antitoxin system